MPGVCHVSMCSAYIPFGYVCLRSINSSGFLQYPSRCEQPRSRLSLFRLHTMPGFSSIAFLSLLGQSRSRHSHFSQLPKLKPFLFSFLKLYGFTICIFLNTYISILSYLNKNCKLFCELVVSSKIRKSVLPVFEQQKRSL